MKTVDGNKPTDTDIKSESAIPTIHQGTKPSPGTFDLQTMSEVIPREAPTNDLSGLERAGVNLTIGFGSALTAMSLCLVVIMVFNEPSVPIPTGTDVLPLETTKLYQETQRSHRAFWLQVMQLLVGNVFLPIVTALLGYLFGTAQNKS